jgi:hypothetical protein
LVERPLYLGDDSRDVLHWVEFAVEVEGLAHCLNLFMVASLS